MDPTVEEVDPMLRACAAGRIALRRADHGTAVRWVQQALIDLGYPLPAYGADGLFGAETGAAVVAFKLDHGLDPPDPVVGASAIALIEELLAVQ